MNGRNYETALGQLLVVALLLFLRLWLLVPALPVAGASADAAGFSGSRLLGLHKALATTAASEEETTTAMIGMRGVFAGAAAALVRIAHGYSQ